MLVRLGLEQDFCATEASVTNSEVFLATKTQAPERMECGSALLAVSAHRPAFGINISHKNPKREEPECSSKLASSAFCNILTTIHCPEARVERWILLRFKNGRPHNLGPELN